MSDFPDAKQLLMNAQGAALDVYNVFKEHKVVFAEDKIVDERAEICSKCEFLSSTMGIARCKVCGCGMFIKIRLAASSCPIDKWKAEIPKE